MSASSEVRHIHADDIREAVRGIVREAELSLDGGTLEVVSAARARETSVLGRQVLDEIIANARIATAEKRPLCQDTGLAVFWVEMGTDVRLRGGSLEGALDAGVRAAWRDGGFRPSVVADPIDRRNTGDNTPSLVHLELTPGDRLRIRFLAKGAGSENQSAVAMLRPAEGRRGLVRYVVDTVIARAAYACPPVIVGVGIGGSADQAPWLAKKALFRPVGEPSSLEEAAALEREMLEEINASGIGPMGLGGAVTALSCHLERAPCHIASLPVAVCLNCHSHRTRSVEL